MTFNALSRVGAFVVVVSLITTISSCEKYVDDGPCYFEGCLDCCADNPHKEFINWYFYDVGSYHIYENQRNGQVDTMLVTDFVAGRDQYGDYYFYSSADVLNRNEKYSFYFTEIMNKFSRVQPFVRNKIAAVWHYDPESGPNENNYALIFPMFIGNQSNPPIPNSNSTITKIHSALEIAGTTYENVVEIEVINDASEYSHHTRYFVAKHVGIVRRMDLDTGDDWQLTEYAVFQ